MGDQMFKNPHKPTMLAATHINFNATADAFGVSAPGFEFCIATARSAFIVPAESDTLQSSGSKCEVCVAVIFLAVNPA